MCIAIDDTRHTEILLMST